MEKTFVKKLVICYLIVVAILWATLFYSHHHGLGPFGSSSDRQIFPLAIFMFVAAFVSLMFTVVIAASRFVYVDARRRGMNPVLWTLVVIFVPYFVGLVVYLVVRSPLPLHCQCCNAILNQNMSFCPQCGKVLKRQCINCHVSLEVSDRFCSNCGSVVAT
jgi:membrane protease YdiL (CAAX protease family)